jgi:hypothetical protein
MAAKAYSTVDAYFSDLPAETATILDSVRKAVILAAPGAGEVIRYIVRGVMVERVVVWGAAG